MSPRELPIWARAVGAVLIVIGSWWVVHTEGLTDVAGGSVGILAVGVVAVSVIRGLGAPLGVWPEGEFRDRFLPWGVVLTAVGFALAIGMSGIGDSDYADYLIDRGIWVAVIVGVVTWGFAVAFVAQRRFAVWYAVAVGLALGPYVIGGIASGAGAQACMITASGAEGQLFCEISVLNAFAFFVPAAIAGSLVTLEVGFRRLLIGDAGVAGVVLIVVASLVIGIWAWVVGGDIPLLSTHAWVLGISAVAAGCLYALSGSLLVSSVYAGTVLGTHIAFDVARDRLTPGYPAMLDMGAGLEWLHLGVGGALLILVWRRSGFLGGVR